MNWRDKAVLFASAAILAFAAGCSAEAGTLEGSGGKDGKGGATGEGPGAGGSTDPGGASGTPTPEEQEQKQIDTCRSVMKSYMGLGGVDLTKERIDGMIGVDRLRIKPFSALQGEIQRVTGSTPASLASDGPAFGTLPARWYIEPVGSAITTYTTYRIAYEAALSYTGTDPKFNTAPTDATASSECAAFMRKAWSRTPSAEEISACKTVAVADTAAETDVKRRWAYAFAAVMTAAGFTTY